MKNYAIKVVMSWGCSGVNQIDALKLGKVRPCPDVIGSKKGI